MRNDLELRHCRALVAVNDRRGIGAAARALGLAQSTVSETLASLERVLGVAVTERQSGREAALTAAAQAFLPHARQLIGLADTALATVARQREAVIRLGTVESVSSFLLPEPLGAFRAAWPQVDVRVTIGLCADLRGRVGHGELDAALTIEGNDCAADAPAAQPLWPAALRLVVAPGHPLAGRVVPRGGLEGRPCLFADPEGAFYELMKRWLGQDDAQRFVSAGSIDGVKRGVAASEAIGVLPDYAVAGELADGSLIALSTAEPLPGVSLVVTTAGPLLAQSPLANLVEALAGVAGRR